MVEERSTCRASWVVGGGVEGVVDNVGGVVDALASLVLVEEESALGGGVESVVGSVVLGGKEVVVVMCSGKEVVEERHMGSLRWFLMAS